MNIKEIIEAWIISHSPTEKQKILAEKRAEVCKECPHRKDVLVSICGLCGCPISKKIFTNDYNPCPDKKWKEVDDIYFEKKENKTLI
jgi:hypothetical protein